MSEYFSETLAAYEATKSNPGLNLPDFFNRLALKTGDIVGLVQRGDSIEPVWQNNDNYPYDIHLAHLFFSYMSSNTDLILSWYRRDGFGDVHLKNRAYLDVYVPFLFWATSYRVTVQNVNTNHPDFSDKEWSDLYNVVKDVINHFGVNTMS